MDAGEISIHPNAAHHIKDDILVGGIVMPEKT